MAKRGTAHETRKQKGRRKAGLFSIWKPQLRPRSVFRDHRAAPAIVDAGGDHIDVLTDAVGARIQADRGGKNGREADVAGAHEQMIVFNSSRPVRRESIFKTGPNRAAPAGFTRTVKYH